jgi:hypothetical protein
MRVLVEEKLARRLVSGVLYRFTDSRGRRVLCNRRALEDALFPIIREAFSMGYQRAQKGEFTSKGHGGPAWMYIRLDDTEALAAHGIKIDPRYSESRIIPSAARNRA